MSRRSEASPRRTSIRRTPSRLNSSTSLTLRPISVEPSGTATSVKNFARAFRPPACSHGDAVGQEAAAEKQEIDHAPGDDDDPDGRDFEDRERLEPLVRAMPSTSRLVDVPISVSVPPMIAA
jgi:hypothetical protein